MNNRTDSSAQAAEFLKRWQEEITRQMHNPDMIRAMLAAMQPFGATPHDEHAKQPAAANDATDDAIAELRRRIAQLERRVSALATQHIPVAAKTKKPAGTVKRSRSKPVAKPRRAVAKKPKPRSKRT